MARLRILGCGKHGAGSWIIATPRTIRLSNLWYVALWVAFAGAVLATGLSGYDNEGFANSNEKLDYYKALNDYKEVRESWNRAFKDSSDNTLRVVDDMCAASVTYVFSMRIHNLESENGEAEVKIKLPEGTRICAVIQRLERVTYRWVGRNELLVHASPGKPGTADMYIRLGLVGPSPSSWRYKRDIPVPEVEGCNFTYAPFIVNYLGTYNGGLSYGSLGFEDD
jgi:hypothetical protein